MDVSITTISQSATIVETQGSSVFPFTNFPASGGVYPFKPISGLVSRGYLRGSRILLLQPGKTGNNKIQKAL